MRSCTSKVKRANCMGQMLSSLLHLQSIERRLATVRGRLNVRKNAVATQQRKIDKLRADYTSLHDQVMKRRKDGDQSELDLRQREDRVTVLRGALNTAKTNKEYAAILTQINTLKADNAKFEEDSLKVLQEVDVIRAEADQVKVQIEAEQKRLGEIQQISGEEIAKLDAMVKDLSDKRAEAAKDVSPETLKTFDRIAASYEGDAMAVIEIKGRRPPLEYTCGGCFMSLNAEHANALQSRDEIRTCNNCGRILYIEPKTEIAKS